MVFVGLIFVAVVAVVAVDVIVQNTHDVVLHAFGHTWTFAEYGLMVVGAVLAVAALLGLGLVAASARSARRARREHRALARENARLNATRPTSEPTGGNVAPERPPQTSGGYDDPRGP